MMHDNDELPDLLTFLKVSIKIVIITIIIMAGIYISIG